MYEMYDSIYWICFFLTWGLVPLFNGYVMSGNFTVKARIWDSLKINLTLIVIVAGNI